MLGPGLGGTANIARLSGVERQGGLAAGLKGPLSAKALSRLRELQASFVGEQR